MELIKIAGTTQGALTREFASSIFVPNGMTLGKNGAPITQAEMAFAWQISATYLLYQFNGYTKALIDHLRESGTKFVHDHSAFRTFFTKGEAEVADIEKILDGTGSDAEKIDKMRPILVQEEAIARKFRILECLGYQPVQVLDLRKGLNIASFLFVHKGDRERDVLPQNVPGVFLSFIFAEREKGQTPEIIRRYTAQEKYVLTDVDYERLEKLKRGETLTAAEANDTIKRLAQAQTRLWPQMTAAEYDAVLASESDKKLPVAAEVLMVGYLLNHSTHRPQDLSANPADAEECLRFHEVMARIVGANAMNKMSFRRGDEERVGERNMQGNTKGFLLKVKFPDGEERSVPFGFVEWAGWLPERDERGNLVLDASTGQVLLAPVFDAGRTGTVFEKQKVHASLEADVIVSAGLLDGPGTNGNGVAKGSGPANGVEK